MNDKEELIQVKKILLAIAKTNESIQESFKRDGLYLLISYSWALLADFDKAQQMAATISEEHQWSMALSFLVDSLVNARQMAKAIEMTHLITREDLQSQALASMMGAHVQDGNIAEALKTYSAIQDPLYRKRVWEILLGISAKPEAVKHGEKAANLLSNQTERMWALGGLARGLARGGDIKGAIDIAIDIPPSEAKSWALWGVAGAQARSGDVEGAKQTVVDLHNLKEAQAAALADLAVAQVKAGDSPGAHETVSVITDEKLRDCAQKMMAVAQVEMGDIKEALNTYAHINDQREKNLALLAIVKKQAEGGDSTGAIKTAGAFHIEKLEWLLYNEVAKVQAEKGDFQNALKTIKSTEQRKESYHAIMSRIVEVQARQGDLNGALSRADEFHDPFEKSMVQIAAVNAALTREREDPYGNVFECGIPQKSVNIIYYH